MSTISWLASLAALALAVPVVAEEEEGAAEEAPAEEEKAAPEAAAPEAAEAPEGMYEVRPGDTLWDISQKELQNPWYWPKVWADNPDLTNPNWIEPGTRLVIKAPGKDLPQQLVSGKGEIPPEVPGPVPEEAAPEAPPEEEAAEVTPDVIPEEEVVSLAGRIGYKPTGAANVRTTSFITPAQLAEAGTIHASFEEKEMLAWGDRIYVKFTDPNAARIGDEYMVYRNVTAITHPVTHEVVGYQSDIMGSVKIEGRAGDLAIGTITQSFDVLERGQLIAPGAGQTAKNVTRRRNSKAVDGVILASLIPQLMTLGEQQVVFLDKGTDDGVQEGNTFVVIRQGDGLGGITLEARAGGTASLPAEDIAELMVIDVKQRACAALVMNSIREIEIGDRVTMRPAGGAG